MSNFNETAQKMPGLNFDAPVLIRDQEYVFDGIIASEERQRTQLLSKPGIKDTVNPNSASPGSGRPLTVQPNEGNPLRIDLIEGVAVTPAGNIISVDERVLAVPMATSSRDIPCVVLLEYVTVDDETTNAVNEYNETIAVRRKLGDVYDANAFDPSASNINDLQNASSNLLKVVTLDTYNDVSKFSPTRLNDVVVLAVATIIADPSNSTEDILDISMTNNTNTFVRPWFSAFDQEHRSFLGTGVASDTNPHATSLNEIVQGDITVMNQLTQTGVVLSRDLDVPGCAGVLCTEFIDTARVFTDTTGALTSVANARYVRLGSYPHRIVGIRENKLDGSENVPDTSVTAKVITGSIVPNTNIVVLGRTGGQNDVFDSSLGFTISYTAADGARPPALPHELSLVSNNTLQFQQPTSTELVVTGGKEYSSVESSTLAMGVAGPVPLRYKVWLDSSKQYLMAPQVVFCAKLIEGSTGIGTSTQSAQFEMYGPARVRVGLWEAPEPVQTSMYVTVEITGKDAAEETITEVVTISGSTVTASPKAVAWDPPTEIFQITNQVFYSITSFRVTAKNGLGSDAHLMLWADIEPTVTDALDDALAVAYANWTGLGVDAIHDLRPVQPLLNLQDYNVSGGSLGLQGVMAIEFADVYIPVANEDLKAPRYQDNVLSKRVRNNDALRSVLQTENLPSFSTDGTAAASEWYYSNAIRFPSSTQTNPARLFVVLSKTEEDTIMISSGTGTLVQIQYITVSGGTSLYSSWQTMNVQGTNDNIRVGDISVNYAPAVTPYFKFRLRILAKNLRGYSVIMRRG